jgi:hypothetical protein
LVKNKTSAATGWRPHEPTSVREILPGHRAATPSQRRINLAMSSRSHGFSSNPGSATAGRFVLPSLSIPRLSRISHIISPGSQRRV